MGHFREPSNAYLLFRNCTILSTISSTTSILKGKATTATINAKENIYVLHTEGKVFPLLEGLESSFWGQIGLEFNFQSPGAHCRCGGCIRVAH